MIETTDVVAINTNIRTNDDLDQQMLSSAKYLAGLSGTLAYIETSNVLTINSFIKNMDDLSEYYLEDELHNAHYPISS